MLFGRSKKKALEVVVLTPETAPWWVEAGPCPNPESTLENVTAYLSSSPAGALLVAMEGDRPVARLQLQPISAIGFGLYAVGFREGVAADTQLAAARALLKWCRELGEGFEDIVYLESDLVSLSKLPPAWREALPLEGFTLISEAYTYELPLGEEPRAMPAALEWEDGNAMPPGVLATIYGEVYSDTQDQAHATSPETPEVRLGRLQHMPLLDLERASWLVAFQDGRPVGLIFTALEAPPMGHPDVGWILEVGVMPDARGRRLSPVLLEAGLATLAGIGARRVQSRIDIQNEPSIRLHERAGFQRLDQLSWLYRCMVTHR